MILNFLQNCHTPWILVDKKFLAVFRIQIRIEIAMQIRPWINPESRIRIPDPDPH